MTGQQFSDSATKRAPAFRWDDPFLLEDQLSEDERMIRDTARAYAQEKLLPRVIEAYRAREDRHRDLSARWASWACSA